MFMFEESRQKLKEELYSRGDNGLHTRLEPIARVKSNPFFPLLPVVDEADYQIHADAYYVTSLDPFQNWNDAYNDLRGIFIQPLVCSTLAQQHALGFTLELRMLFINLLSLSPARAMNSAGKAWDALCYTVCYAGAMIFAAAALIPCFALRCLISIADLVAQLITPNEQNNPVPG